jgi:hypothetical protein
MKGKIGNDPIPFSNYHFETLPSPTPHKLLKFE